VGLGRRTFAPGEVLTASNVMNYLQDQAVMNFAGTAARGSAIGTAVAEGMVSYLNDTDNLEVYRAIGTAAPSWNPVAFRSEVESLPTPALVPIIAPTVRYSAGTATANTDGTISFSAVTSIAVDNVFSSTYQDYKIIYTVDSRSVSASTFFRFTTTGTQTTSALWYYGGAYWGASGSGFGTFINANADFSINNVASGYNNTRSRSEVTVSIKDQNAPILDVISNDGPNGSGGRLYGGRWNDSGTDYDGFRLNYSSGNVTGTLKIYGIVG